MRVVQSVDVESVEIAEDAMHPVALFDIWIHWKRLTARWRRKTPHRDWRRACRSSWLLTNESRRFSHGVA
jgi:hypothetical protein